MCPLRSPLVGNAVEWAWRKVCLKQAVLSFRAPLLHSFAEFLFVCLFFLSSSALILNYWLCTVNCCLFWSPREESACGRAGVVRPASASPLRLHPWDLRRFSLPPGPLCVLCKMGDWSQLSLCDVQAPGALLDVFFLIIYNVCWSRETTNMLCRHPSPAWETRLIHIHVSVQMSITGNHTDWML